MPTLILDDVPLSLYDQIQRVATAQKRTAADTVLEVLEIAFCEVTTALAEAPVPREPFSTDEITAPFTIPRPEGTVAHAVQVAPPLPTAHDIPEEE